MPYVFPPAPTPTIPIAGATDLFPVGHIYCVGRNYAAHASEMGADPAREPPFFFCKPASAIVIAHAGTITSVRYPSQTANYQHEIELVVAIGKAGTNIAPGAALEYVWGYAVGLDMTRRDLQLKLREQGRPWELGKAFADSAPVTSLVPASAIGYLHTGAIWLTVDGNERQRSDLSRMIWSVPEVIANLSVYFELKAGDLIFTGTPEGVSAVARGAHLHGGIEGLGEIEVRIV